ncbi:hypothetical protein AAFF_G00059130, partial [Aldrovandia affinis]
MLLGLFFYVVLLRTFVFTCAAVSCMIINMEYKHCTWNEHGISEFNYTFHSRLGMKKPYEECPTYLQEGATRSGETESPPQPVTAHAKQLTTVAVLEHQRTNHLCGEFGVIQKDTDQKWTSHPPTLGNYFSLPFPSESNQYTFKVKTRVAETCLESMWSDWSTPVFWGPIKVPGSMDWKVWVSAVICCVVMAILVCLLVQNERLRIILIPIVPNVSKSLEELFYTYNGNVEDWLHISKEFVEGFK